MNWFQKILKFFGLLNDAAEKAFNSLSEEQQLALINGSALLDVLGMSLNASVTTVKRMLVQRFPNLDAEEIEASLFDLANAFGFKPKDLNECIVMLQEHLQSAQGEKWGAIMHGAACIAAIFFGKSFGVKAAAAAELMEHVYRRFIQKKTI